MFFPIGDDNVKGGSKPLFSYSLIFINVLVFIYEFGLPVEAGEAFVIHYGTIPAEMVAGQDLFTVLTSMFLHGGWAHLIGNMLFLWVFADNIEAVVGTFNFILFYVLGGIAATLIHVLVNPDSDIPVVGASGAISAVMGAYLIMFPASRIKVWILFLFSSTYVPALFFLGIWIVQQMISGFGSLGLGTEEQGGVAWWAHIGGFAFGLIGGLIARKNYRNRYHYGKDDLV
ncbi:MAG: rhomboid family intramembrane serine protease [Saprospiraceae bacterium]|nr:rhomboid family intramembrane serine protease [Saprospiraceae bacterium]MBK8450545.1 rhomboid family intramembrane serine protease [Saprospiraceae bacterium]MBK9222591.1 rhomboid family intramembrane serine protease [Saprospiraceae bacterium]MBK9720376.1 rhomboid family intramembrane serine protease [Saprospiraceae bacterium]MBK9727346.1 rhomboid family intramembrane serine protease [Saprospiraceae bacterium]